MMMMVMVMVMYDDAWWCKMIMISMMLMDGWWMMYDVGDEKEEKYDDDFLDDDGCLMDDVWFLMMMKNMMMLMMMMITMMTLSENTAHPKTKAVLVPYSQSGYHLLQSRLEGASSLYKAKRPKNQHHSLSKRRCSSQTQKAAAICPPKANETQNSNAKHLGTNDVRSILVHIYIHSSPETKRHFHIHIHMQPQNPSVGLLFTTKSQV